MATAAKPRRAVIYARLSKDRNKGKEGEGLSVGKQEADCRELAARLDLTVVEPVRNDNDLTAFKGASRSKPREGYEALLDDIRTGRADVVLAWHTDRLHRDMAELEEYIKVCGDGSDGVPTYTVKGGELHLDTSNGRMVARIMGAVARGEVEHMIERQKSAKERIRKAGAWQGGPRPYGYRKDGPSIKQGGQGRLAQVPEEAQALRWAAGQVLAGVELRAICREMTRQGLLTPPDAARGGGKPWVHSTLRNMLKRASNAGLIEHEGEIVGPGNWDAIIDETTWRRVRAILTDPARRTTPGPAPKHLLTGALRCGKCKGTTFRVLIVNSNRDYRSYVCDARHPDGRSRHCVGRNVTRVDALVEAAVIEVLSKPGAAAALLKPGVDMKALDDRRRGLRAELNQLAAAKNAGKIDLQQLIIMSEPLQNELDQVEDDLSRVYRGSELEDIADAADPAAAWKALKDAPGGIERRRAIVKRLFDIEIQPIRGNRPEGFKVGDQWANGAAGVDITPRWVRAGA